MEKILIRPLHTTDRGDASVAQAELARENFDFLLGLPGEISELSDAAWTDFVASLAAHEHGEQLPEGWVPETFRIAEVDGQIVGRVSARHSIENSEFLTRYAGHIGYGVRAGFRQRGIATALLRFSLEDLRGRGVERALVTCDDANVGSAATIERCGGVLAEIIDVTLPEHFPSGQLRRYWIDLTTSTV